MNNGISQSRRHQFVEPVRANTAKVRQVLGVRAPKLTVPAPRDRVLVWRDDHRNVDRVLRWQGPCLWCGVQTWSFDDGENDPRGILGDSALWGVDIPNRDGTPAQDELEARACPMCANDETCYRAVQRTARRLGYAEATPYNYGKGLGA